MKNYRREIFICIHKSVYMYINIIYKIFNEKNELKLSKKPIRSLQNYQN